MGAARDEEARPVHGVKLPAFFLSKFEVTQEQWLRSTGLNRSEYRAGTTLAGQKVGEGHPVERVSFEDASFWAARVSLRLPSEAEWEYAARAGGGPFAGSLKASELEGYANLADQTLKGIVQGAQLVPWRDGHLLHAPVGSYRPNGFGLYDVAGNVYEWVEDTYRYGYEGASPVGKAETRLPGGAQLRFVYRGGGFLSSASLADSTQRNSQVPEWSSKELGIRPALSLGGLE